MTTYNIFKLHNGNTVEIRTNPGAVPMVSVNGVIQTTDEAWSYMYLLKTKNLWEPITLMVPRRINGRWYWPGARVYRRYSLGPGGGFWMYGDEFDILKND
jgi:hypothetical protein